MSSRPATIEAPGAIATSASKSMTMPKERLLTLLFTPLPLSNIVPALVIALIALAYLEEDGLLLSIALLAAVIVLAVEVALVWETVRGAKWISGLW